MAVRMLWKFVVGRAKTLVKNYNVLERAEKVMEQNKKSAPRHPGTEAKFKVLIKGDDVSMKEVVLKANLETETNFTVNDFEVDSPELPETEILTLGDFVVVEFITAKSKKRYVGQVLNTHENDYEVLFMKKSTDATFVFPTNEDKSWVETAQIIKVLSQPTVNSRGHYRFNYKIEL